MCGGVDVLEEAVDVLALVGSVGLAEEEFGLVLVEDELVGGVVNEIALEKEGEG